MGFGLLFLGYLIAFLLYLNPYAAVTRLIGYCVIFAALTKLRRHNRWFAFSQTAAIPLMVLALVDSVIDITTRIMGEGTPAAMTAATGGIETAMTLLLLVFHVCLLMAVYTIAQDTDLPSLAAAARRNIVLIAAYAVLHGIWSLPVKLGDSYTVTLSLMVFVLQLIWTVADLILIFRCYMWICLEGDEDMAQKPSRFAFVNRFREKFERHNQKAAAEAEAYAAERRAARGGTKKKRKHKK
ncbi:MAG: hypothetical protein E7654_07040 [Ruminococcaceae bacterium]|nr:hypothetical protein [Oscillospiraceae bacterium]